MVRDARGDDGIRSGDVWYVVKRSIVEQLIN